MALVENVVRQQLNPVDEAFALKVLLEDLGVTQEKLAARVGKSRSAIANKIRLLDLPAPVQESLAGGALSEGHARALLSLEGSGGAGTIGQTHRGKGPIGAPGRGRGAAAGSGGDSRQAGRPVGAYPPKWSIRYATHSSVCSGLCRKSERRGAGGVIELPFKDTDELARLLDRLT